MVSLEEVSKFFSFKFCWIEYYLKCIKSFKASVFAVVIFNL